MPNMDSAGENLRAQLGGNLKSFICEWGYFLLPWITFALLSVYFE